MQAAVISAVLIASVLDGTAAEGQAAEVMPWAARLETSTFNFRENGGEDWNYQWTVYPSITVQPSRYLWMHGGMRMRETAVPGFIEPYREVGSVKVAAIAQILPGALYMVGSGNYVLWPGRLQLSDSLALSEFMDGYSPFESPAFLSVPGALGGLLLRFTGSGTETLLGANYFRPGMADPFDTLAFQPASHISFSAQYLWEQGRHGIRIFSALYGEEATDNGIVAHREGPLLQSEYRFQGSGNRWGGDLGGSFKFFDSNRRVRLDVALEPAAMNDNLQRGWIHALRNLPFRKQVFRAGLGGVVLWGLEEGLSGYETTAEVGWGLPLEKQLLEIRCRLLSASQGDASFLGVGFNFVYSMRRVSNSIPGSPLAQ